MANETKNPATPEPKLIALQVTMSDIVAEIEAEKSQRAALRPANKSAVFAALAGAGIATVIVSFDGYGDSGQIDSIDARDAANTNVPLPDQTISIVAIVWGQSAPESRPMLTEAIEHLVYDALSETTADGSSMKAHTGSSSSMSPLMKSGSITTSG